MSKSHFFKHLSYTFSWGLRRSLSLSSLSSFKPECRYRSKPNSSLFSMINLVSSFSSVRSGTSLAASHDTSATTDSSAYLSVRIRCPKEVAIHIDSVFPQFQDVDVCLSQAADSIGLKEIPAYEVKMGEQCDWIQKTQESFHPLEVTEGLWIVPEGRSPPDVGATNIILNPGLAFGTGEHSTTKLCLLLLRGLIKGGEFFLDYGTGSGILAIAAVKFGASLSVGIDVDPQAITSASRNAALNDIRPETMELRLVSNKTCTSLMNEGTNEAVKEQSTYGMGPVSETEKYDVVIANILLNPLLELADHIVSYAKPGAVVGLSGILSEQLPYIMDRYSVLLEGISVSEIDDWACVSGKKKRSVDSS